MQEAFDRLDRIRASADWRAHRDLDTLLETKGHWTHPAEVVQNATPEHLDKVAQQARARLKRGSQTAPLALYEIAKKCWLAANLDRLQNRTCWVHPSTVLGKLSREQLTQLRVGAEERLQDPDSPPGIRRIVAACQHAERLEWMADELASGTIAPQRYIPTRSLRGIIRMVSTSDVHDARTAEITSLCRDEIGRRKTKPRRRVPRIDAIGSLPRPVLYWTRRNQPLSYDEFLELPDPWWLYEGKLCLTLVDIPGYHFIAEWQGPTYSSEEQRELLAEAPYWQGQIGAAVVHMPSEVWPRRRERIQVKPAGRKH